MGGVRSIMPIEIDAKDLPKIAGKQLKASNKDEINRIALKLLGVLSEASSQEVRRKALDKARRMVGRK